MAVHRTFVFLPGVCAASSGTHTRLSPRGLVTRSVSWTSHYGRVEPCGTCCQDVLGSCPDVAHISLREMRGPFGAEQHHRMILRCILDNTFAAPWWEVCPRDTAGTRTAPQAERIQQTRETTMAKATDARIQASKIESALELILACSDSPSIVSEQYAYLLSIGWTSADIVSRLDAQRHKYTACTCDDCRKAVVPTAA